MKKALFLDTNIFLNYQDFDNINWIEEVEAEEILIIIPPIIIHELQKHKDLYRMRTRKRAEHILKKLYKYFKSDGKNQLPPGVEIYIEDRSPKIDFPAYQLSPDSADDNLIASIIMFNEEAYGITPVLITSDMGLLLLSKAEKFGINVHVLPDNLKLPDKPDPEQEKIRELEKEISEISHKMPRLSLVFKGGSQNICLSLSQPTQLTPKMIETRLEEVKAKFPKMHQTNDIARNSDSSKTMPNALTEILKLRLFGEPTREQVDAFNLKLENYYGQYSKYLEKEYDFISRSRRAFVLDIYLRNDGTAPADDIDIIMSFLAASILVSDKDFLVAPKPPIPPQMPKTQMATMMDSMKNLSTLSDYSRFVPDIPYHTPIPTNVSLFEIEKDKDYKLSIHVKRIKHGFTADLRPLHFAFLTYNEARSFHIDYWLLAANVSRRIGGRLNININKQ